MPKLIVNVIGFAASGKSSACKHLCERYGFTLYRPSDTLRAYAKARNRPLNNRQDYINCHAEIIADDPLAMMRPVLESTEARICIDGFRAPEPYKYVRDKLGARLVYLDCPIEQRFARAQADAARTGHRSFQTLEAFRADEAPDYHNDNPGLPSMDDMIPLADYRLDATQPFAEVLAELDRIVASLLAEKP